MDNRAWTVKEPLTKEEIKAIEEHNKELLEMNKDIIITEVIEEIVYNEDGSKTVKYTEKKTNLTKQINETAKLMKLEQAERVKKLQEFFELTNTENKE